MYPYRKLLPIMLAALILTACKEDPLPDKTPAGADFTYYLSWSDDSIATFQFVNLSYSATNYLWEFGDNLASGKKNPVHQYFNNGNYKIRLSAYNEAGIADVMDTIIILEFKKLPPTADFDFYIFPADTSVRVQFTNHSTHIHSCNWNFGDGAGSSQINPIHHYYKNGSFRVRLKDYNALWQVDSVIKFVNISF